LPAQAYRLRIDADGARIDAADDAGEFYARQTLAQLTDLDGSAPESDIEDWPDIAVRGVMLDVSRDKVPTMATLYALVDELASLKVNQLQLYMEHTFAYCDHEVVWAEASPYTADDIAGLDAYCRARFVELVPNQNCLGHMERWLRHPPYDQLAASPDGFIDWSGRRRPPTTLDPLRPESLTLVRSLLAELLPTFTSTRVNVGLDEPWELGPERFDDYLSYVRQLLAVPELAGRQVLMWGDIVAHHPDRLADLPPDVIVCEWGYEADHPYRERLTALAAAGLSSWVCPGTSSWNSVLGRTTNALGSCREAVAAALDHGSGGSLVTDWGDNGHLQHLPVSEAPLAFAAAVAWCLHTNRDIDLAAASDAHVFRDRAGRMGRAMLDLGDAHTLVAPQLENVSILVVPLLFPWAHLGRGLTAGLTADDLERVEAAIDTSVESVAVSAMSRADADQITAEVRASADLVLLMCDDARARLTGDGTIRSVAEPVRAALAARLAPMVEEHRRLWLARNRPGGLDESVEMLERVARGYRGEPWEPPAAG
jgi:hypothetical protein